MRQIKFRVWDKEHSEMFTEYLNHSILHLNYIEPDKYIVMQFTGLQDKNGVDIYCGDILRGYWGKQQSHDKTEITGEVKFNAPSFVWQTWLKDFNQFDKHGCRWVEYFAGRTTEYREVINIKVIGNIYENPEMVKP